VSKTRAVPLISLGKYLIPADPRRPYFAGIDLKGDGVAILQPLSEGEFMALVNSLIKPTVQNCGQAHQVTVAVPA